MSKEKVNNPFAAFNVLKGDIIKPSVNDDNQDDEDVETGADKDKSVINEDEQARLDAGTKLIEENIKKAEALRLAKEKEDKAAKKVTKTETIEEVEEDEEEEIETSTNTDEDGVIKTFAHTLYEKGVLDFSTEDEDFEDSEQGLEKIVDKTVENRINKYFESLPDEYTKFLEFVKNGGNPKDFLSVYYSESSWSDFDISSEDAQRYVIKQSLLLAGESEQDAEDMILDYESTNKLDVRAKSALSKMQKHSDLEKQNLLEQQKQAKLAKEKADQEYWNNFKSELYAKKDIMGFKLNQKVKDNLWNFLTVVDKHGETAYTKALKDNKDSSLLFALQAMQGFDIAKLEKQVTTKVTSTIADKLRNSKTTKEKISGGSSSEHVSEDPFALFGKVSNR